MSAGVYDFAYEQGTDVAFVIRYLDDALSPVNLTGFTVVGHIRKSFEAEEFRSLGTTLLDAPGGEIRVAIPRETFEGIVLRGRSYSDRAAYVYDIEITAPGGDVLRLLNGTIFVSPEVTR